MPEPSKSLLRQIAQEKNPHFLAEPPDLGAANTFINSGKLAFNQSFGSALQRNGQVWMADRMSERNGLPPITEDQFNEKYSMGGELHWEEGMSEARAMLLAEWKNQEKWTETKLAGSARNHWVSSFAGGIAGSVIHPIDIATMVLTPGVGVVSGVSRVAKAGVGSARSFARLRTFGNYVMQGAKAGAIDGAWQSPAMLKLNGNIQANYSTVDAAVDFLASPIFGGFLGGMSYMGRKMVAGVDMQETFTGEDGAKTALTALSRPEVAQKLSKLHRMNELTKKGEDLTPEDLEELRGLFRDEEWGAQQMPQVTRVLRKVDEAINAGSLADVHARSHTPTSEEGVFMSDIMSDLFGVEVRSVDMGPQGLVFGRKSGTLYINEKAKGADLIEAVGHEFSHSLRLREPELFQRVMEVISENPKNKKIFEEATKDIRGRYGDKWDGLTNNRKLDEGLAQTMGRVFKNQDFWDALGTQPGTKQKLVSFINYLFNKIKSFLGRKPNDIHLKKLSKDLAEILAKANPSLKETDSRWFTDPTGFAEHVFTPIRRDQVITTKVASELNKNFDLAKTKAADRLGRLDDGNNLWFGVPLDSWISHEALRIKNVVEKKQTITNPGQFIRRAQGIPVLYKNGKKLEFNSKTRNLQVDKIEFYDVNTAKLSHVYETVNDQGVPDLRVEFESKADQEKIGDDLSEMSFEEIMEKVIPLEQKAKWARELHAKNAEARNLTRKELGKEKAILRMQLKSAMGDMITFHVDGKDIFRPVKDLDEGELYAAWVSLSEQMRVAAGIPAEAAFTVHPPDAMLEAITLSSDLIDRAIPADPNVPSRVRTRQRIEQMLGGKNQDRVNRIEALIEVHKSMRGDVTNLEGADFFGLTPSEYGQAIRNLDEQFSTPEGFFEVMELPSPENFKGGFAKFQENIRKLMDKLDVRRNKQILSDALEGEKILSEKVGNVSDKGARLTELETDFMSPEFKPYLDDLRNPKPTGEGEGAVLKAPTEQEVLVANAMVNNEKFFGGLSEKFRKGTIQSEARLNDLRIPDRLRDKLRPIMRAGGDKADYLSAIKEQEVRTNFNLLNDHVIKTELITASKQSRHPLKFFSTKVDGLFRRDIEPDINTVRSSVEHQIHGRVTEDIAGLMNVLDAEAAFGAYMDDTIVADIVRYLESDRTADVPAPIKRMGEVIFNTYKKQVNEMDAAGADVKWLKGFALTQNWDLSKVRNVPFAEFKNIVLPHLDMERVNQFHETAWESPEGYLKAVYDDMASGRAREPLENVDTEFFGGNIGNQVSHHRSLFLKEGGTFPVMSKFGRGDSVGQMIVNQIRRNAERSVIMENFGSNYKQMWSDLMDTVQPKNTKDEAAKWLTNKTFEKLTGDMDMPVNQKIADIGQNVRRYSNLVFLWQSGIAALNDMGGIVARLKYEGSTVKFRSLRDADTSYWKAVQRALKNRDNKAAQIWLRSNGAALASVMNNMSNRVALGETATGKLSKWNNFLFNINGLNFITDLGQSVYMDLATLNLGSGDISPDMLRALDRHGIGINELMEARGLYARETEGYAGNRLSPDMFETSNPGLARKLRNFLEDGMRQAVIEPGVREQTIARGGTQAGTIHGEAIRVASQYITFPLAIQMKTIGRFMNAYGEREFAGMMASGKSRAVYHALSFAAAGIVMGYTSTVIKDILKGREPIHFGNLNSKNMTRIIDQSGVTGIIGPLFDGQVSPMAREAGDLVAELGDGDISAYKLLTTGQGLLPGATIPLVGSGQDSMRSILALMIGDGLGMQYETNFQSRLSYIEREFGQDSVFDEN